MGRRVGRGALSAGVRLVGRLRAWGEGGWFQRAIGAFCLYDTCRKAPLRANYALFLPCRCGQDKSFYDSMLLYQVQSSAGLLRLQLFRVPWYASYLATGVRKCQLCDHLLRNKFHRTYAQIYFIHTVPCAILQTATTI